MTPFLVRLDHLAFPPNLPAGLRHRVSASVLAGCDTILAVAES